MSGEASGGEAQRGSGIVAANDFQFSAGFGRWLIDQRVGLVATISRPAQLLCIGACADGSVIVSPLGLSSRNAVGIAAFRQRIYLASHAQIWRFENMLESNEIADDIFEGLYVRRNILVSGHLDIHELEVESSWWVCYVPFRGCRHQQKVVITKMFDFGPILSVCCLREIASDLLERKKFPFKMGKIWWLLLQALHVGQGSQSFFDLRCDPYQHRFLFQ